MKHVFNKKALALLLAVLTLAALLPVGALAAERDCDATDCVDGRVAVTDAEGAPVLDTNGDPTYTACSVCGGDGKVTYNDDTIADCTECGDDAGHTFADHCSACGKYNGHEDDCSTLLPTCSVCGNTYTGDACKHTVTFKNGTTTLETQTVACGGNATAPELPKNANDVTATGWNPATFTNIKADLTVEAVFPPTNEESGDTIVTGDINWASDIPTDAVGNVTVTVSYEGGSASSGAIGVGTGSYSVNIGAHTATGRSVSATGTGFDAEIAADGAVTVTYTAPNNEGSGGVARSKSVTVGVYWVGLPVGVVGTVNLTLNRGITDSDSGAIVSSEIADTKTVTGNTSFPAHYTFTGLAVEDADRNAYVYTAQATASVPDDCGYTCSTPSVSSSSGVQQVTVTCRPTESNLQSLAQQFAALVGALPSIEEAAALCTTIATGTDATAVDAARTALANYLSAFNSAKGVYNGLSGEDKTLLSGLVAVDVMAKYTGLVATTDYLVPPATENAEDVSIMLMADAVPKTSFKVDMTFVTTGATLPSDAIHNYTVELQCSDSTVAIPAGTISVTNNTVKTYSYTFNNLDACDANNNLYGYSVKVWPATPTGFTAIRGSNSSANSITFQQTPADAKQVVVVNAKFEDGSVSAAPSSLTVKVKGSAAETEMALTKLNMNNFSGSKEIAFTSDSGLSLTAPDVTGFLPAVVSQSVASSGGTTTVTYTVYYQIALSARTVSGNVYWRDKESNFIASQAAVTLTLYQTDVEKPDVRHPYDTVTLAKGETSYAFPNIPYANINGKAFRYAVEASPVGGYTTAMDGFDVHYWADDYTRTHLKVKVSWSDTANKRGLRPTETTVYLYLGKELIAEKQVGDAGSWMVTFPHLQRYANGTNGALLYYTVRAAKVPYYYAKPVYVNGNTYATLAYHYGRGSYNDAAPSTGSTGTSPKVGDPTLFRSALSDKMYADAAASAKAVAAAARANNATVSDTAVDFGTLTRTNADVTGWLTLPGTSIDYPIVRGKNNTEYLARLYTGEANSSGTLFMDYHNNAKYSNRNTTVFGHNMKDGSMFATLLKYKDQSFYDANKTLTLQTPDGNYTVEPVAGFFTDAANANVVKRTFANNEAFLKYVEKCIRASNFQSSAKVAMTDKLITFVTCSDNYEDGRRYLLVCKLSPAS